jgi:hypothetical protein
MNAIKKVCFSKSSTRQGGDFACSVRALACLGLFLLLGGFLGAAYAQSEQTTAESAQAVALQTSAFAPDQQAIPGSIRGTVLDQSGALVAGADVMLTREGESPNEQVTAEDGHFSFANIAPGPFQLTITAEGFASQTISGVLQPGDNYEAPQVSLRVASAVTAVQVEPPRAEIAEAQIREQEKQRVLAIMPNFYVSYVPDAVPLTSRQKFHLAWRTVIDPFTFVLNGAIAGAEQAGNEFPGYGQGAQGYGKRFGAGYADIVSNIFIGSAILPSILKQDPRYFYRGTGSKRSRLLYAIANSVICKGDNGRWQLNYSNLAGSLAAGGISNLYYPKDDRHRLGLVFENTAIGIGETAVLDVFQEFFIRNLMPKPRKQNPSKI